MSGENADPKAAPADPGEDATAALAKANKVIQKFHKLLGGESVDDALARLGTVLEEHGRASTTPDEKDATIADLRGQIASRDHKDAFRKAAGEAGVKPGSVDDLYSLSGLKPGEGEAKAEDFAGFLASAKEGRSWAFGEAAPADPVVQPIKLGAAPPLPAGMSGRGGQGGGSPIRYRLEDVAKPGWQRDRPELCEAIAKGTAICIG